MKNIIMFDTPEELMRAFSDMPRQEGDDCPRIRHRCSLSIAHDQLRITCKNPNDHDLFQTSVSATALIRHLLERGGVIDPRVAIEERLPSLPSIKPVIGPGQNPPWGPTPIWFTNDPPRPGTPMCKESPQ